MPSRPHCNFGENIQLKTEESIKRWLEHVRPEQSVANLRPERRVGWGSKDDQADTDALDLLEELPPNEEARRRSPPAKVTKTYERQPRHKTRVDRYDLKVAKNTSMSRPIREGRKRGTRYDFRPPNVNQSRLTLKPGQHLGIFCNGKSSAPTRRRGVPDLSFTKMTFLKGRRNHVESEFTSEAQKPPPKNRERTDQHRYAERFSGPSGNFERHEIQKPVARRGWESSSNRSRHRSGSSLRQVGGLAPVPSGIPGILPQKAVTTLRGHIHRIPVGRNNLPAHALCSERLSAVDTTPFETSGIHFPWSQRKVSSHRFFREPLGDLSKQYLTLDDLHVLFMKRLGDERQQTQRGTMRASLTKTAGSQKLSSLLSNGTRSIFRAANYEIVQPRPVPTGLDGLVKRSSPPRDRANTGHAVYRGIPETYARQLHQPVCFDVYDHGIANAKHDAERQGFLPNPNCQYETRNNIDNEFAHKHADEDAAAPFEVWEDAVSLIEDEVVTSPFSNPSISGGLFEFSGCLQKYKMPLEEIHTEFSLDDDGENVPPHHRLFSVRGVDPKESPVLWRPLVVQGSSSSVLRQVELDAATELLSKGFWRPQRF